MPTFVDPGRGVRDHFLRAGIPADLPVKLTIIELAHGHIVLTAALVANIEITPRRKIGGVNYGLDGGLVNLRFFEELPAVLSAHAMTLPHTPRRNVAEIVSRHVLIMPIRNA